MLWERCTSALPVSYQIKHKLFAIDFQLVLPFGLRWVHPCAARSAVLIRRNSAAADSRPASQAATVNWEHCRSSVRVGLPAHWHNPQLLSSVTTDKVLNIALY